MLQMNVSQGIKCRSSLISSIDEKDKKTFVNELRLQSRVIRLEKSDSSLRSEDRTMD